MLSWLNQTKPVLRVSCTADRRSYTAKAAVSLTVTLEKGSTLQFLYLQKRGVGMGRYRVQAFRREGNNFWNAVSVKPRSSHGVSRVQNPPYPHAAFLVGMSESPYLRRVSANGLCDTGPSF